MKSEYKILMCTVILVLTFLTTIGCGDKQKQIQRRLRVLEEEGALALKNGDFQTAKDKLKDAIKLNPEAHGPRNNLAVLYARYLNELDKAKLIWEELLIEQPHNSAYLNNLAGIYKTKLEYGQAIDLYEESKKHHPTYNMPFYNIGLIYIDQKKYPEAVKELKAGMPMAESDSNMIASMGTALILNGDLEEARKFLTEKYKNNPNPRIVALLLCQLHKRMGNYEEAGKIVDGILNFNPLFSVAIAENIELAIIREKGNDEIENLLLKLETSPETDLKPWYQEMVKARLIGIDGNTDAAVTELEAVQGKIPARWNYFEGIRQYELAKLYHKAGEEEKAALALEQAKTVNPLLYADITIPDDSTLITK